MVKTLPITVLISEGPIARAYLSRMSQANLQPGAITLLVYSHHPKTKKQVGRWLPGAARRWYAEKYQELAFNDWPRRLSKSYPSLVSSIIESLKDITENPAQLLGEMLKPYRYDEFTDGNVKRVFVKNLRDSAVSEAIQNSPYPTVLYTGGGIVPGSILRLPDVRVLHTHPGHLPHVRGADGILWSTLVRGKLGVSCFFMAESIDTGPIIDARDFPRLHIKIPDGLERPDDNTLYQSLFSFCDPILRAEMLVSTLERFGSMDDLPLRNQDPSTGITYHYMHKTIQNEALNRLFVST